MMDVSFFAEMAWKSALISGAALSLAWFLRSRSAADRALVLRIGIAMLLLLPPIAMLLPGLRIEAWQAPEAALPLSLTAAQLQFAAATASALPPAQPTIWDDPTPLVILAYLGGLAMVGSRILVGLWMLGRWTSTAREVTCPQWRAAFERTRWAARRPERLRLLVSDHIASPLSWGWINPVVLIDPDSLSDPDEADSILAHEVAHISRGDWPALMLGRATAALFWFNPLVWLLEREVVQQAEEAADCEAAQRIEPARYAQTLLSWAQADNCSLPAHSIAPRRSALARRVQAVLDRQIRERESGSAWTAVAILLCVAIAAPVAAAELVEGTRPAPPASPAVERLPRAPAPPVTPAALVMLQGGQASTLPSAPRAATPSDELDFDLPDIGPIVDSALAETLPLIPGVVESALAAASVGVEWKGLSPKEREQIQESVREALRESSEIREEALREAARIRVQAVRQAHKAGQDANRRVRFSDRPGVAGFLRGAEGMERGAREMEEKARRLQTDRAYREEQITRARARGKTLTHEDLLEVAEGLRDGAEGMREGARGMREAARDMARTG